MVKCVNFEITKFKENGKAEKVMANLIVDEVQEILNMGSTSNDVVGLEDGIEFDFGSTYISTSFKIGMLNSLGEWVTSN